MSSLRAVLKLCWLGATFALIAVEFAWLARRGLPAPAVRARWCCSSARRLLRCFGVAVRLEGVPPGEGMVVSNHLSYLDIVLLAAIRPAVFVSKAEVRSWPVLGRLTRYAGTLYIRRDARHDVHRMAGDMKALLAEGMVVVLFPEGTSSDGASVLPFHSSLLAPAAEMGCPVTPAFIRYELPAGAGVVGRDVCYWGEMTLLPHLFKLLSKRGLTATVRFGACLTGSHDRKRLAAELHQQVRQLGGFEAPAKASGKVH
ncbi:MAG: lysophospholipid acyltransferase family protein [Verrucomicrobiota bacterium]